MEAHHIARVLTLVCVAAMIYETRSAYIDRSRWLLIVSGLRIRHFVLGALLLLAVFVLGVLLHQNAPQWAQYGWLHYVGGTGSA
ncbi:hypothetical protein, partial [Colwellia marinimaniae]|uniref:hypothetical protein n=1 Tax=Colwellia marinimaniae TaxID=1513592 RepID=UPI001F33B14A